MAGLGEGTTQANRSLPGSSYVPEFENATGGGTYTAVSTQPSIKDYENVFGPIARNIKDDLQMHKRHGRWHLPDVLKGSNPWLADRIDGLISDANNSPFTTFILPYRYHENVDGKVKWNVWSFDEGMASRVPYESAARHLTQSKKSYAGYLTRSGLAIKMEHNFMMTPKGRENFQNNLMQLIGSIQYTNDYDVTMALVTAPSYETERKSKYMDTTKSPLQICREYVDLFGFVQKNPNALDILIEEGKFRMKEWNGPQPNFMLVNAKLGFIMNMTPEKTNWYAQGPDGVKRLKAGPELNSYRGLRVINTRSFQTEAGLHPRDMLRRRVRVAEYYRILPDQENAYREFELYNEARDSWFGLTFTDLLKMSSLTENEFDGMTGKGAREGGQGNSSAQQETEGIQPESPGQGAPAEAEGGGGPAQSAGGSPAEAEGGGGGTAPNAQKNWSQKFDHLLDRVLQSNILSPQPIGSQRMQSYARRTAFPRRKIGAGYRLPPSKTDAAITEFETNVQILLREKIKELPKGPCAILLSDKGEEYDWMYLHTCPSNFALFSKKGDIWKNNMLSMCEIGKPFVNKVETMSMKLAPYPNFHNCFEGSMGNGSQCDEEFIHVLSKRYAYEPGNTDINQTIKKKLLVQPVGGIYEPNNNWFMNTLRSVSEFKQGKGIADAANVLHPFYDKFWNKSDNANNLFKVVWSVVCNTIIDAEMAYIIHEVITKNEPGYDGFFENAVDQIITKCQTETTRVKFTNIGTCTAMMKTIIIELFSAIHTGYAQKVRTISDFAMKHKLVTMWTNEKSLWTTDEQFIAHPGNPQFDSFKTSGYFSNGFLLLPQSFTSDDEQNLTTNMDLLTNGWNKVMNGSFNSWASFLTVNDRNLGYGLFKQLLFTRVIGDFYQFSPLVSDAIAAEDRTDVTGFTLKRIPMKNTTQLEFMKDYPLPEHPLLSDGDIEIANSELVGLPLNILSGSGPNTLHSVKPIESNTLSCFQFLFQERKPGRKAALEKIAKEQDTENIEVNVRFPRIDKYAEMGDTFYENPNREKQRELEGFDKLEEEFEEIKFYLEFEGDDFLTGKKASFYTQKEGPREIELRRRASYLYGLKDLTKTKKDLLEANEKVQQLTTDIGNIRTEIMSLKQEKEDVAQKLTNAQARISELETTLSTLQATSNDQEAANEIVRLTSEMAALKQEKVTLTQELDAIKADLQQANETLTETKASLEEKKQEVTSLKASTDMQIQALRAETVLLKQTNDELQTQLKTYTGVAGSKNTMVAKSGNDDEMETMASFLEFIIVRPNIEHNMMGIILGMAGEQLGFTLWGQTELAVYDDSMHGLWGMSYKYHSKAIVFNFKNLIRLWDVCYDGYNGGKDDTFVNWNDQESVLNFQTATTDVSKNYNGASMMVFRIDHQNKQNATRNILRNWPSPIVFHEFDTENGNGNQMRYGIDNEQILDVGGFRVFNKDPYKHAMKHYFEKMPPFAHLHNTRKGAAESIDGDETTGEALAFQGSMRIKSAKTGTIISEIHGSGHHGPDYVGVASIRAGKGVRNPSSLPSLFRPI